MAARLAVAFSAASTLPAVALEARLARQQVVAGVAVGHVDDRAPIAEIGYVGIQHDLHERPMYPSKAISRAFLIATATSR